MKEVKMKEIKPSEKYIKEVKDLMQLHSDKAEEYFSAKRVSKEHGKALLAYMVRNKVKDIDGIHLGVYKGYPYLKLEKDVFSRIDSSLSFEE